MICWDEVPVVFVIPSAKGLGLSAEDLTQDIIGPLHGQSGGFQSGARRPYSEFTTTLDP